MSLNTETCPQSLDIHVLCLDNERFVRIRSNNEVRRAGKKDSPCAGSEYFWINRRGAWLKHENGFVWKRDSDALPSRRRHLQIIHILHLPCDNRGKKYNSQACDAAQSDVEKNPKPLAFLPVLDDSAYELQKILSRLFRASSLTFLPDLVYGMLFSMKSINKFSRLPFL